MRCHSNPPTVPESQAAAWLSRRTDRAGEASVERLPFQRRRLQGAIGLVVVVVVQKSITILRLEAARAHRLSFPRDALTGSHIIWASFY